MCCPFPSKNLRKTKFHKGTRNLWDGPALRILKDAHLGLREDDLPRFGVCQLEQIFESIVQLKESMTTQELFPGFLNISAPPKALRPKPENLRLIHEL